MPILCLKGDITKESVDAIVNAANSELRGGGGVDGAIHRAAGPGLLAECRERYPNGCPTGEAVITAGHELAARYVIHTVGPIYSDGEQGEPELLAACYGNSVQLAAHEGLESLAFPAISCGVYAYPPEAAAEIAMRTLHAALAENPGLQTVRMVLFSEELLSVFETARRRLV